MENFRFEIGVVPSTKQIVQLYKSSGINRPYDDECRIEKMYINSNLIVTAWNAKDDKLVAIARSLTDFCYCCYLSDLAVDRQFQNMGIGQKLIQLSKQFATEQSMLLLLAAPEAYQYYNKLADKNKLNIQIVQNGFIIPRKK